MQEVWCDEGFRYVIKDGVATVTLDRTASLNALTLRLAKRLRVWFDELRVNESVRSVILTGALDKKGRPCFSSGADLTDPDLMSPDILREGRALMDAIEDCDCVVVAAIDGVCTGGGLELAMCCDIRVGARDARMGDLHLKNQGIMSSDGSPARLPRIVGLSNAKLLLFTCKLIGGEEAFRIGLLDRLCSSEELLNVARNIANDAAALRPEAVRMTKHYLNLSADMGLQQALHFNQRLAALADPDLVNAFLVGQQAFVEKRKVEWVSKSATSL